MINTDHRFTKLNERQRCKLSGESGEMLSQEFFSILIP